MGRIKLLEPPGLFSGYVTVSAPPESCVICHYVARLSNPLKTYGIPCFGLDIGDWQEKQEVAGHFEDVEALTGNIIFRIFPWVIGTCYDGVQCS